MTCFHFDSLFSYYENINGKLVDITDEIPFDLPESWCWCRLSNILISLTDGTHSTPKYTQSGIPFVSVKDMSSGILDFSKTKFISIEESRKLNQRCNPCKGDILLSKVGTTGIPVKVDTDIKFSLFVSLALLKYPIQLINDDFLIYVIKSPCVQLQAKAHTRGVGNKNWVLNDIGNTLIPLAPLQEQQEIATKLNSILKKVSF